MSEQQTRKEMIMEDFIPFEIALKLREKGFREECLAYYRTDGELLYNRDQYRGGNYKSLLRSYNSLPKNPIGCEQIDAPTISQVLKWLREGKGIHICISCSIDPLANWEYEIVEIDGVVFVNADDGYSTYEESALAGIEYAIDNLI